MDLILLIVGFIVVLLGVAGAFLPILPGPLTSWVGLLLLYLTKTVPINYMFLGITLAIAILIWFVDYLIPAAGAKHFGGTKYGAWGTTIGLIAGLLSPIPFGFVIGAFAGALIGELLHDSSNIRRAFKASFGAFIGFLASTTLKFLASAVFVVLFIMKFWKYKDVFFM